ncbi:MAG TPA: NADP-dependent oxidoreductase [Cytophagaceae bacterium]|nr:NADP-dependent oxidoreductase [Cytophagaceae bacterium]
MKAYSIHRHGPASEVFETISLPIPEPEEGELLIRVKATSINPLDIRIRTSSVKPRTFPLILGYDVSGVVEKIGSSVINFKPNDRIYASPHVYRQGANAEYVVVKAALACQMPEISFEAAAAVPLAGLTAWEALHDKLKIPSGETILIHGGAGGVGHFAIQFAKLHGCKVITTAGREESKEFCKKLGADLVLDYKEDWDEQLKEKYKNGLQYIFDTVGGDTFLRSGSLAAVNGNIVTILPVNYEKLGYTFLTRNINLFYEFMGVPSVYNIAPETQGKKLEILKNFIEAGLLKPHIGKIFPFEKLAQAHEWMEREHTLGKIVVVSEP